MKVKDVLITGVTGTTCMTMFSYLVSMAAKENFSEPERLAQLARRLAPPLSKKESQLIGWLGHYGVGLLFAAVYLELWSKKKIKPTVKNNLLLGTVSGLVAVAIWKTTFKMHPLPPALRFNNYYSQLIPAHVVFALFAGLGYHVLKKIEQEKTIKSNKIYAE